MYCKTGGAYLSTILGHQAPGLSFRNDVGAVLINM